jgi:hypothetical protein
MTCIFNLLPDFVEVGSRSSWTYYYAGKRSAIGYRVVARLELAYRGLVSEQLQLPKLWFCIIAILSSSGVHYPMLTYSLLPRVLELFG